MRTHTRLVLAVAAALTLCFATPSHAQQPPRHHQVAPAVAARVDALLRQMTLEEKVGEMTQLTSQAVSRTRGTATTRQSLDTAKLDNALLRYNVGSLLNVWDAALTPQEWRR